METNDIVIKYTSKKNYKGKQRIMYYKSKTY
jgi:hypothetical protein